MGADHRPGPGPLPSSPRAARAPELWVVIEVPEPVRSEVLAVRRIVEPDQPEGPGGDRVGRSAAAAGRPGGPTGTRRGGWVPAPIIGRFVALRRFPQTRYVYLAPDDEMATSLLILQDRLVEYGLKLAPDVYQATPHAVIGRVPPEAELEVAAGARALVPSPTFRMTTLALWSLTEQEASCLHRVALSGVL